MVAKKKAAAPKRTPVDAYREMVAAGKAVLLSEQSEKARTDTLTKAAKMLRDAAT